jgi:hypothetical protein
MISSIREPVSTSAVATIVNGCRPRRFAPAGRSGAAFHRAASMLAREDLAAALLHVVVRTRHARDRVEEDDDVLAALDQAPGPLGDDLGHRDVVLRREIRGGGDHFAPRDAPAKIRDLFRALVDQEHDDVHVRIVDLDGVGHALQQRRLAGLRRRHDEAALAAANRGQQIDHSAAHFVRLRLELQNRRGVDGDELGERRPLAEGAGLHAFDGLDAAENGPIPIGGEARDEGAGLESLALNQIARNQRVLGRGQVVGFGRDEHAGRGVLRRT